MKGLWQCLLARGFISQGTMVGVQHPHNQKATLQFVVNKHTVEDNNPKLCVNVLHTDKTFWMDCDPIIEVDGMSLERYCSQAGIDLNGNNTSNGKKRGRKPKIKTQGAI